MIPAKPSRIRLVGIGQPLAGDDGIGIAVVRRVSTQAWSKNLMIDETLEPLRLIDWLAGSARVVLVDALLAQGPPGRVMRLEAEDLAEKCPKPISSHGFDVAKTLELAKALYAEDFKAKISMIAITIQMPPVSACGLSAEVESAIPEAMALIRDLVESEFDRNGSDESGRPQARQKFVTMR